MWPSLAAVLALSHIAAGLNFTFTGNCSDSLRQRLGANFRDLAYFNTTGTTTSFSARAVTGNDDPWYYYLTLRDGSQNGDGRSLINRWLGVPGSFLDSAQGNRTRVCVYTSSGYDKGLKHTQGNDTCDGILSDKCMKKFNDSFGSRPLDSCSVQDGEVNKECHIGASTGSDPLSKARSCFFSSLPGVDVPAGYGVVPLLGGGYGEEQDKNTLAPYDKVVRQAIATIFAFVDGDRDDDSAQSSSKVLASQPVCAVPNVVQHGSRPVDSAGEKRQPPTGALAATVWALIVGAVVL